MTFSPMIIVGGGLAGLATAYGLLKAGVSGKDILLIQASTDEGKASQAPCAICHPFPGQSFQLRPHVLQAFAVACDFLAQSPRHLRRQTRVSRWLSSHHGQRERLLRSYERLQAQPLGPVRVKKEEPTVEHPKHVSEVFEIEPAWVANLQGIGAWLREELENQGVRFEKGLLEKMQKIQGRWVLNDGVFKGEKIVLALGAALPSFFSALPSQKVWGHLIRSEIIEKEMDITIGDGHLASMDNAIWGGASFLPQNDPPTPEQEKTAIDGLRGKMAVLTGNEFPVTQAWCGTRLVMGHERLPVAGEIPGLDSCFVIGGAGANGLLWLPYLAEHLATEIQMRREIIPEAFQPNRYDVDCWRPDRQKIRV